MKDPFQLSTYIYPLPPERIAQRSVEPRDASRLMVVHRDSGKIEHRIFRDMEGLLQPGDLLMANNSQVIRARFHGVRRETGGKVEVFLLRKLGGNRWESLYRGSARARDGIQLEFGSGALTATIVIGSRIASEGVIEVEFDRDPLSTELGQIPLPPYIEPGSDHARTYETAYASQPGSVAAPTAGFHWTPELLQRVRAKGVQWAELTLHVGLGTFRPMQSADIREHRMHEEFFNISSSLAESWRATRQSGKRCIAVGTTTVRALESAWDPASQALRTGSQSTKLFINPGYSFHTVDGLITNFHLPESTLLVLVSAFAGLELTREAYAVAIQEKYRFYSFGDAMLVI